MAVTVDSFKARHRAFARADDDLVTMHIATAELVAGPALGALRDEACMLLIAHYLVLDPRNENMALAAGATGETIYLQQYEQLVASVRPFGCA